MSEGAGRIEKETGRIEAFSDGVFAIAITLLVLEIKVPHTTAGGLGKALLAQWPSFAAFVTSFATIGIMWINHHKLFNLLHRTDHLLLILNGLLLLGVTFVPFPTAVVAAYLGGPGEKVAVGFYSGTFVFIAIVFNLLWRYASSEARHPRLLRVAPDDPVVKAIHGQYLFGPVFYSAALLASPWNARLALAMNLGLALFFAFPPRGARPR